MPKILKALLLLLLIPFLAAGKMLVGDTTTRKLVAPSKMMSYQVSDFSIYIKEGLSCIRKDSIDKGIRLLSTGLNYAISKNDIKRVLNYQFIELVDLLKIASNGQLSVLEKQLAGRVFKGVFAAQPGDVIPRLSPYFKLAPVTQFSRRLKILILSDEPHKFEADLDKLLIDEPDLMSANLLKAETLYSEGKYSESIGYCTKVIMLSPEFAHAFHIRAKSYEALNLHMKAQRDYDEVVRLFPHHYEALYERAEIYQDKDQYRDAITGYLATLAIRRTYRWCYYNLARAYKDLNMPDSAMFYINTHINLYKQDADGLNIKGLICYDLNDYKSAIELFDKAIANNPGKSDFYENRGDAYFYSDNSKLALADFKKALSLDKNNRYLLDRIGNCYHKDGKEETALHWYTQAIKVSPDYKYAYVDLEISLNALGRHKEAIDACNKAIMIDSTYSTAVGNKGWSYYCLGDFDSCIKYSYKAIALDSSATYAMFNIALATLARGDVNKAKELYITFVNTCKEKNFKIQDGAVEDLKDFIKKGIAAQQAQFIIDNILKKTD